MKRSTVFRVALLVVGWTGVWPVDAAAQTTAALPAPLGLDDVIRIASERRDGTDTGA
jgi:hypothetical protein